MAFTIEVEEWVGSVWHRFITRRASPDFPEARVELESMQRPLSLLFRAMGGASGVGVEAPSARDMLVRRNLLQQVAGTCKQLPVAWCDASNLRLPQSLAVYPEVDAVHRGRELGNESRNRLSPGHRIHRNVVVDPVLGEVGGQLRRIRIRPFGAELGHHFIWGACHPSMKASNLRLCAHFG